MSYKVFKIDDVTPQDFKLFFFDANVWIATLKYLGSSDTQESYEGPYVDFFQSIITLNDNLKDNPKLVKKVKNIPKIALTSIVLSETINAYMRIEMKAYFNGNTNGYSFKKDYRDNPTTNYKAQFKNLISDISAFEDYTVLIDDDFSTIKPFKLLSNMPHDTDFNDYYYYNHLVNKNIPIITHDADFIFDNIIIITNNQRLLS